MHENRFARMAGPLLAALLFGACGSDNKSQEFEPIWPAELPRIDALIVDPSTIDAGGSATLSWETQGVDSLALVDGAGSSISLEGHGVEQGSITVRPDTTTSYTLTGSVEDPEIAPVWRTVTVTVRERPAESPTVVEFRATPEAVGAGSPVTVSWKTTGATRVAIDDDIGSALDLRDAGAAQGQVEVKPTRSLTTYTLTADGPGGRATKEVSVGVTGLPRVVRFDIGALTTVDVNDTVTLRWETSNASDVIIKQDGQPLVLTSDEFVKGSREILISGNTEFTLVATSAVGKAEARVEARVGPRITAFSSTDRLVRTNGKATLRWELVDADRATIDGPGGFHHDVEGDDVSSGEVLATVAAAGDFVLQAFRGDAIRTASVFIDVTIAPMIRSFDAERRQISASPDRPGSAKLIWTVDGGDSCTIYRGNAPVPGYENFACEANDTAVVPIFAATTLRLEARNAHGLDSAMIPVETVQRARVAEFVATPDRRLGSGDSVMLSWEVEGAASVSLAVQGGDELIFDDTPSERDSFQTHVDDTTTFILTAKNALGDADSVELTVRVAAPEIITAVAEPSFVGLGQAFELKWNVDGGDELTVIEPGGTQRTIVDPAKIDNGSMPLVAPSEDGSHQYAVRVENDEGEDERFVTLIASNGPVIVFFTTDRSSGAVGESLTLSWKVTNDSGGITPTLSLIDDHGHDFTPRIPPAKLNEGTLEITPDELGSHTYTLTATTSGRREHARKLTVEVTAAPAVLSEFKATPDRIDTEIGPREALLSWKSRNAVELQIFEADAKGNALSSSALHRVVGASELAAGTFEVRPTATTRYLARVWNSVGAVAEELVTVWVDLPVAVSIQAEPAEIFVGETTTLRWTTRFADSVRFYPLLPTVTPLGNTYVDISSFAQSAGQGSGIITLQFPKGFVFPFGGVNRTEIQVSGSGWAGFGSGWDTSGPGPLPNDGYRYVNFAVYAAYHDGYLQTPGTLYYGMHTDDEGDSFIIQWTRWKFAMQNSNLNFQLVLRPNGDFEYRYGTMTSPTQEDAEGAQACLGFQFGEPGSPGLMLAPNRTWVYGGFANKGWAFRISEPANGSLDATPLVDTTFMISALGQEGTASAQTFVKVWKVPVITGSSFSPITPAVGDPLTIKWTTTDATRVRILDPAGAQVYVTTSSAEVANGSHTLTETMTGDRPYTVEAMNGIARNITRSTLGIKVYRALRIDDFTATPASLPVAGTVTFAWTTTGAADMRLIACPPNSLGSRDAGCSDVTPPDADPTEDEHDLEVAQSRDFWLRILAIDGRAAERKITVQVQ